MANRIERVQVDIKREALTRGGQGRSAEDHAGYAGELAILTAVLCGLAVLAWVGVAVVTGAPK